jgi:hypothetical protein
MQRAKKYTLCALCTIVCTLVPGAAADVLGIGMGFRRSAHGLVYMVPINYSAEASCPHMYYDADSDTCAACEPFHTSYANGPCSPCLTLDGCTLCGADSRPVGTQCVAGAPVQPYAYDSDLTRWPWVDLALLVLDDTVTLSEYHKLQIESSQLPLDGRLFVAEQCGAGHYVPDIVSLNTPCRFLACPAHTIDDDGDPLTPCVPVVVVPLHFPL